MEITFQGRILFISHYMGPACRDSEIRPEEYGEKPAGRFKSVARSAAFAGADCGPGDRDNSCNSYCNAKTVPWVVSERIYFQYF